jgi:hypothetical protein
MAKDVDKACFFMMISNLPKLFEIIGCLTNMKVKVRDHEEFDNWLHIISNHVIVKI